MALLVFRPFCRSLGSFQGRLFTTHSHSVRSVFEGKLPTVCFRRGFASQVKSEVLHQVEARHGTQSAYHVGRLMLAGGSIIGIGSLCYYGLGLSKEEGAIDRYQFWPKHVRERISKTFLYFAGGLGVCGLSALAVSRSPGLLRIMANRPILSSVGCLVGAIGSSLLCMSIPYSPESLPMKLAAFAAFGSFMGASLTPLLLVAGPLAYRAAAYTAVVVGGLSFTAACAPSDKFLHMAGPLSIGLGIVCVASIGGLFMSPGGVAFSIIDVVTVYGGLLLFSGFLLYDCQNIFHKAELSSTYDPVNESIGIYLDTVNIFIRILTILINSNSRKKR